MIFDKVPFGICLGRYYLTNSLIVTISLCLLHIELSFKYFCRVGKGKKFLATSKKCLYIIITIFGSFSIPLS